MVWLDARLPIRFGALDTRKPGDAVLTDELRAPAPAAFFTPPLVAEAAAHPTDCTCCQPRTGAATALASLFRDRAVSAGPPFRAVLAVVGPAGESAIRAAVGQDPLVSARYRIASG